MSSNPKLHHCKCGNHFVPKTRHKILMLLFGSYSWTCPQCHTKLKFELIEHVVKTNTEGIKNPEKIWRNS